MTYKGSAQHSQIVGLGLATTSSYTCLSFWEFPSHLGAYLKKQKKGQFKEMKRGNQMMLMKDETC